jgi:hypothetical protein
MARQNAMELQLDTVFVKTLIVGDYGTGKSVFASTFPTPGFLFDFDKGALTYKGKEFEYAQYPVTANGWVEFEKDFNAVVKEAKEGKFKTIVFDSTSLLTDLAMERALQLDPKRSPTNGPLWNVHYGIVRNLVEGKIRQLLQLDANIVVISHLEIVKDQESGAILGTQPLLPGALSTKMPGYFDEVYFAFSKIKDGKPDFYLQTLPRGHYKARSRISGKQQALPFEIPNDYPTLLKHIEAEMKKDAIRNAAKSA